MPTRYRCGHLDGELLASAKSQLETLPADHSQGADAPSSLPFGTLRPRCLLQQPTKQAGDTWHPEELPLSHFG